MNIQEQIKVMQHFADGGEVVCCSRTGSVWQTTIGPVWNWAEYDYRIKEVPKPKVKMWQALLYIEDGYSESGSFFMSEDDAIKVCGKSFVRLLPHTEIEVEE